MSLVTVENSCDVLGLTTLTAAAGMTAPAVSWTIPVRDPYSTWAAAGRKAATARPSVTTNLTICDPQSRIGVIVTLAGVPRQSRGASWDVASRTVGPFLAALICETSLKPIGLVRRH